MKRVLLTAGLAILIMAVGFAQNVPSETNGKALYDKWCTPCHGAVAPTEMPFGGDGLPGTSALRIKYRGELPAVLEERTDLVPVYITTVVRGGLFGMPMTRKTEISDGELEDIIAYLTRNNN